MSPTVIECGSGIERVTVYARGAVVQRRVTLPDAVPEGVIEIRVPGLTALADPGSVRAVCDGDREVTALSARLALPEAQAKQGSLAERLRAIDLDRARLDAERASASELRDTLARTTLDPGLSRWAKRLDPVARFADAAALHGLVGGEIARLDGVVRDLDAAIADNIRARESALVDAAQGTSDELEGEDRARLEVVVRLAAGAGKIGALAIEYVVGAARWWPAYSARFTASATRVSLTLDALVAQATGEDWSRVRLSLSTAHLAHDARLPELASLRLGRAQPAPKRGYRAPPEGLAALFEGYDRAVDQLEVEDTRVVTRMPAKPKGRAEPVPATATLDTLSADASVLTRAGYAGIPVTGLRARLGNIPAPAEQLAPEMAAPSAAPAAPYPQTIKAEMPMKRRMAPPPARKSSSLFGGIGDAFSEGSIEAELDEDAGLGGGGGGFAHADPSAIEPADAWLDFDTLVLADPKDRSARGRLIRDPSTIFGSAAQRARARIDAVAEPAMARDPLAARGRFDHRYDAEGTADVPASGRPHRVAVGAADTGAAPCFVAVPREAAEVYREAEIKNPFDAPLLAGPVDVFLDGALMTTSEMTYVDRSGSMRIGLGVEDRLRVARNARVDESTAGLLGGSLVVDHAVTIDLSSSLGRDVTVDVIERVPVTDEKDVEVKLTYARPDHERYTQAERGAPLRRGLRFSARVPAGDKAKIELGYRVTLPAKNEIVGGNRRE